MLKLEFVDNSQASYWIVDSEFRIGSSNKNQLVVVRQDVAPFHAKVFEQGGKLFVEQVTPSAKVRVNYKPINQATSISVGDVIGVAGVELKLIDPSVRQRHFTSPEVPRSADSLEPNHLKQQDYPAIGASTIPKKEVVWKVRSVLDADKQQLIDVVDVVSVGRDPSNDIVIKSSHISRRHAEFFVHNDQLLVRDLDSSNGTYVNGERIKERSIFLGDEVAFDSHLFRVAVGRTPSVREEMSVDKTQFRPALHLADLTLDELDITENADSLSSNSLASAPAAHKDAEHDDDALLAHNAKAIVEEVPAPTASDTPLSDILETAKQSKPATSSIYLFAAVGAILFAALLVWVLFF